MSRSCAMRFPDIIVLTWSSISSSASPEIGQTSSAVITGRSRKEIAQLEALDGYFSKRVLLSSLFQKLQAIAPPEVFFRTVEMSGDGELTISGFAQSSAAVSAFQSRLIDSEVFCSVQWKFSTKRAVFNGEYAEFQIQSRLKQQG